MYPFYDFLINFNYLKTNSPNYNTTIHGWWIPITQCSKYTPMILVYKPWHRLMGRREIYCVLKTHASEIQFFVYLINRNCYHLFCPTLR